MSAARICVAALVGASVVIACKGNQGPPPDPCVDSLSVECAGAVGAPTRFPDGGPGTPVPPTGPDGGTDDPDVAACDVADVFTMDLSSIEAILAGPLAVTADHVISLAASGITITPKTGGESALLYATKAPGTSLGPRPFVVAANGKGYLLARISASPATSAMVEITLPAGPATEVATLAGEDSGATFLGQAGDELFFSTHFALSGAAEEGDLQVRAFDTQTKQLRKVVTLPTTFDQSARYLGERNGDYWFGSSTKMVIADPVEKTTSIVTPSVLGYAPERYIATSSGLYTFDLDGNWVILDDQLYVATEVNSHPSNGTTHEWDLPVDVSGTTIFATQRMNDLDDDLLKLKRIPRGGSAPAVVVCGLSERRVVFDGAFVYFARAHHVLARHPLD